MPRMFALSMQMLHEGEVVALIERGRGGDAAARERAFWGLARLIPQALWALRERGQGGDLQDLESVGAVTVLEAIDAYPLGGEVPVHAFVYTRIRRALLHYFMDRELQGGRLTRGSEKVYMWVKRTQSRLLRTWGRLPNVDEILAADDLPATLAEKSPATQAAYVRGILEARRGRRSLDKMVQSEDHHQERDVGELRSPVVPGPDELVEARLMHRTRRRALRIALARLTAVQREAIERTYLTGDGGGYGVVSAEARLHGISRRAMSERRQSALRRLRRRSRFLSEHM